jgi:hypothetical protein
MDDEQLGLTLMRIGVVVWDLGVKLIRGLKASRQVAGVALEMCAVELQGVADRLKADA